MGAALLPVIGGAVGLGKYFEGRDKQSRDAMAKATLARYSQFGKMNGNDIQVKPESLLGDLSSGALTGAAAQSAWNGLGKAAGTAAAGTTAAGTAAAAPSLASMMAKADEATQSLPPGAAAAAAASSGNPFLDILKAQNGQTPWSTQPASGSIPWSTGR